MTTQRLTVDLDANLRQIQDRFNLTEDELSRAFDRAARRTAAAGYGRAIRQLKRLTGEGNIRVGLRARAGRGETPEAAERRGVEELSSNDPRASRFLSRRTEWLRNRAYSSVRHTGEGRVWVGLNPRVGQGRGRFFIEYPNLTDDFEGEPILEDMEKIFQAELEKAAIAAVSR